MKSNNVPESGEPENHSVATAALMTSFIPTPPTDPSAPCTPEEIFFGPPVEPLVRIKNYSDGEFENFIREWAFYYRQVQLKKYSQVGRFGGAGDMGRDVVGYIDTPSSGGRLDIFQCKRYDHALYPGDIWVELGKLCYFTFNGAFAVPDEYRFVAPEDVGPELGRLFEKPDELRARLIDEWDKNVGMEITKKTSPIKLEGALLEYVNSFNFSRVGCKPMHEIIAEHKKTLRYAPRFGGGLQIPQPPDPVPPSAIQPGEQRYVEQLIEAYQDDKGPTVTFATLAAHNEFNRHFNRSRERYFCAEALRLAVRDSLPEGITFEQVQEQVHDVVIDVAEDATHPSGFKRVKAVTEKASMYHLQNHPLRTYMKSKVLTGICHQLANVNRLIWVPK